VSEENVDRVKQAYEAYLRDGWEALLPYLAPDVEWDMTKTALDGHLHQGHDGVRAFFEALAATWDGFRFSYDEFMDVDDADAVVAIGKFHGRGRASRIEVDALMVHVWTLQEGIGVRLRAYLDRDQALEAVGLRGSDG
jgi:ketosteroid isomerase-like protein